MLGSLRLRVVTREDEFEALRRPWNAVLEKSPDRNVFLTWEWHFTWWKHYGQGKRLSILLVEDDKGIAAIAPLIHTRVGPRIFGVRVLRNMGYNTASYGGILLGPRDQESLALILSHLERETVRGKAVATISRERGSPRFVRSANGGGNTGSGDR